MENNMSRSNDRDYSVFQSLGIYYIENTSNKKKIYFNILLRKIAFQEDNKIDNFFFQDVTDLVNYQITQYEENLKKQKVFAKISHEFKTPLNSIIGIINIIQESEKFLTETLNKNLDLISNLSNYIIYLISDIIQYVSIQEINELNVNLSQLDFKDIINFCYQTLISLIACNKLKSEKIKPHISFDEDIENFIAESDENRIKQVLLNFVSNSVKFTKEGSISINCKTIKIENQFFIEILIKDTGIGIKECDKEKLFKDFGLIENKGKAINNKFGTGLGLSICKSIVEKLKLKLKFESEYMKGSKFSILIPCIKSGTQKIKNCHSDKIHFNTNKKPTIFNDTKSKFKNCFSNEVFDNRKRVYFQEYLKPNTLIQPNVKVK